MGHSTKLRKVGSSVMLTVPPALLDELNLAAGAKVGLTVENGRLVVDHAVAQPGYSLDELLAQCAANVLRSAKDQEWLDAPPVGREAL